MERILSEKKALKKLSISDWGQITVDKIPAFMVVAQRMDPDVVKAAINQFQNYSEMVTGMLQILTQNSNNILSYDNENSQRVHELFCKELDYLNQCLIDPNLSDVGRKDITNAIVNLMRLYAEEQKDSRSLKKYIAKSNTAIAGLALIIAGAILGVNISKTKSVPDIPDDADNLGDTETDTQDIE